MRSMYTNANIFFLATHDGGLVPFADGTQPVQDRRLPSADALCLHRLRRERERNPNKQNNNTTKTDRRRGGVVVLQRYCLSSCLQKSRKVASQPLSANTPRVP